MIKMQQINSVEDNRAVEIGEFIHQKLHEYYKNDCKKLHKIVDLILQRLRFYDVYKEDFYSLANEIIAKAIIKYDFEQDFDGYIYRCLENKFKTEMTRLNRYKRKADKTALSLDESVGNDEDNSTLGDMIASNINIEKEILGDDADIIMNEKIERYLDSLSKIQRKIIEMKMQNIEVQHIKEQLGLTDSQYSSHMQEVVQYEHIRLLHI